MIVVLRQVSTFSVISWREQLKFLWDEDNSDIVCRHVAPLGHIESDSEPTGLCPYSWYCVVSVRAINTNFIVFNFGSNPRSIQLKACITDVFLVWLDQRLAQNQQSNNMVIYFFNNYVLKFGWKVEKQTCITIFIKLAYCSIWSSLFCNQTYFTYS